MRSVLLASLRTNTRRYVASAVAVVIGVTFVVTIAAISSAARGGLVSSVGAPFADADVVATDVRPAEVAPLLAAARRDGARAEVVGSAFVPVRVGDEPRPVEGLDSVGQVAPRDGQHWLELVDGAYPDGAGQAVVGAREADEAGVGIGDRLELGRGDQAREVTVTGLVRAPLSAAYASVYVTEADLLPFARDLYPEAVTWSDQGSTDALEQAVRTAAPRATVQEAGSYVDELAAEATRGVDVVALVLLVFAAVALFVSALVITNSFAILVAQRQRELALLRCVGATRAQVRRSVRLEALVLGVVASGLGLLVGTAAGAGVVAAIGARFPDVPLGDPAVSWRWYAAAAVVGVAVTVGAAWLPTRRATRVSPLAALRPEPVETVHTRAGRVRLVAGCLVLALGVALLTLAVVGRQALVMVVGGAVTSVAVLLLGPVVTPAAIRLVGRAGGRLPGGLGLPTRLAADNAVRNPRRTAATAASLLVGVTLTTAVLTGLASVRGAVDAEMSTDNPLDVTLTAAAGGRVSDGVLERVDATDGVGRAVAVPGTTASAGRLGEVLVLAPSAADVDAVSYDPGGLTPPAGTAYVSLDVLGDGGRVPRRVELTVDGESVSLRAALPPSTDGFGSAVVVAPDVLASLTDAPATAAVWARATDGADAGTLADGLDTVAGSADLDVAGGYASRAAADLQLDVVTGAVVGLLALSVVIALVGIGNTLGLSVLERGREHALLRALGLTRRQLRTTLGAEALLLSVVATVLGTLVGTAFGWVGVQVLVRQVVETAPLVVPWGQLALVVLASAVAGVLAAVLPARRAARTAPAAGLALQ